MKIVVFINAQYLIFSDSALTDPEIGKFFVPEKIEEYRGFGGVRIEDDIIITKDGCEVNKDNYRYLSIEVTLLLVFKIIPDAKLFCIFYA